MNFNLLKDYKKEMDQGTKTITHNDIIDELLKDSYPVAGFLKFPVPDLMRSEICQELFSLKPAADHGGEIAELSYIAGNNCLVVKVLELEKHQQTEIQQSIWRVIQKNIANQKDIYDKNLLNFFKSWPQEEKILFAHMFGVWMELINSDGHDRFLLISSWTLSHQKIAVKSLMLLMSGNMLPSNLSYREYQSLLHLKCNTLNTDSEDESHSDNDNQVENFLSDHGQTPMPRNTKCRRSRKERNQRRAEFLKLSRVPTNEPQNEESASNMYETLKRLIEDSSKLITANEFIDPDNFGTQAAQLREEVRVAEDVILKTYHSHKDQVMADITKAKSIVLDLQALDLSWKKFQSISKEAYKEIYRYQLILQKIKAKGHRDPQEVREDMNVITKLKDSSILSNSLRQLSDLQQELNIVKRTYDDLKTLNEQAFEIDELLEEQLKIMEQQVFLFEEPNNDLQLLADKQNSREKFEFVRLLDHWKILEAVLERKKACICEQKYEIQQVGDSQYQFGPSKKKRMVRILRSSVMVRIGGGWEHLDAFLAKHDPCQAQGRQELDTSAPQRKKKQPRSRSSFR